MLTDYQKRFFENMARLEYGKWYRIDPNRPDRKEMIDAIYRRIDLYYDLEFSGDYKHFRRCLTVGDFDEENRKMNQALLERQRYEIKQAKLAKQPLRTATKAKAKRK